MSKETPTYLTHPVDILKDLFPGMSKVEGSWRAICDSPVTENDLIGFDLAVYGSYAVEATWDTTTDPPTLIAIRRLTDEERVPTTMPAIQRR